MTSEQPSERDQEEVLLAFSVEPVHDRATLERYLLAYPEHAPALVECSIELISDATRSVDTDSASETTVDQAWQRFQNAAGRRVTSSVLDPFGKVGPTAFRAFAKKLNVSNLFLIRVRDRAIDAMTIPQPFVEKLAIDLGSTVDAVFEYLRCPPAQMTGSVYRSSIETEAVAKISFAVAIETSQLSSEQKESLKEMLDSQ